MQLPNFPSWISEFKQCSKNIPQDYQVGLALRFRHFLRSVRAPGLHVRWHQFGPSLWLVPEHDGGGWDDDMVRYICLVYTILSRPQSTRLRPKELTFHLAFPALRCVLCCFLDLLYMLGGPARHFPTVSGQLITFFTVQWLDRLPQGQLVDGHFRNKLPTPRVIPYTVSLV